MSPARIYRRLLKKWLQIRRRIEFVLGVGESKRIASGWNDYANEWNPEQFEVFEGFQVKFLGDEWTGETSPRVSATYGLTPEDAQELLPRLYSRWLEPHIKGQICEIGPGGGRLTEWLLRLGPVIAVDASAQMLRHLRKRFSHEPRLSFLLGDGKHLALPPASVDAVVSFDVFVHFEPRLVYYYLRQLFQILRPGGVALIHYSNATSRLGIEEFVFALEDNLEFRQNYGAFGVMSPDLMEAFLHHLGFTIREHDLNFIPRDALVLFEKPDHPTGPPVTPPTS